MAYNGARTVVSYNLGQFFFQIQNSYFDHFWTNVNQTSYSVIAVKSGDMGKEVSISQEKLMTSFMDDPISDDFAYAFTLSPLHLRH